MTGRPVMPARARLVRTTPEFTDTTVPAGLREAHRVAPGVWGRLRVLGGTVTLVFEDEPPDAVNLGPGEHADIPPSVPHRVEPSPGCRFVVEFHREPDNPEPAL